MFLRPSRRFIFFTVGVGVLLAGCVLALPEVLRRLAVNRLESVYAAPVTVADLDLNFFTGRATIEGLRIGDAGRRAMVDLPLTTIEFSRTGLLLGRIVLERIALQRPQLIVERLAPNRYNILDALRAQGAPEPNDDRLAIKIENLWIHEGKVTFIDRVREPSDEVTFSHLNLSAGPVSTVAETQVTPTQFTIGVRIADGTVKLTGSTTLQRQSLGTKATAKIAGVKLETFRTYLPYGGNLNLEKSLLSGEARYVFAERDERTVEHYLNGSVALSGLAILPASGSQPIVEVPGLSAQGVHIDLVQNQGRIGKLILERPNVALEHDAAGLNLAQLLPETTSETAAANPQDAGMRFAVRNTEIRNGRVEFIDRTVSPEVKTLLEDVDMAAKEAAFLPAFAVQQITAKALVGKGSVKASGTVHNQPLKGEFSIVGKGLPFQPYSGYLNGLFTAALSSGDSVDGKLNLTFASASTGSVDTAISGDLEGRDMGLQFPEQQDRFFVTERLAVSLNTLQLGSKPRVDIARMAFSGAGLSVVRGKDNTLNVARLWTEDRSKKVPSSQSQRKQPRTFVAIRKISIEDSSIEILDKTVSPNYRTRVANLSGELTALTPSEKRADLKMRGTLGESAKIQLTGWFTPFAEKPHLQLEGTIRSYALPPLNPYATEYVSHRIRQGEVTTDVKYTLQGDEIRANAEIVLRDLRLGEETGDQFRNRIGMPLELAIALLQDIQGVIRLRLAMSGDNGPKLNVPDLIWSAVRNAIVRAITAPFRLVGKILTFGGKIGRVQIEPIRFEPGTRTITPESNKQLGDLAEILKEKPRLALRLDGHAGGAELDALKGQKFWQEIERSGADDYQTALIQVYKKLGGVTKLSVPLKPEAEKSFESFVMEHIQVSGAQLRTLSRERAEIVKNELEQRGIDSARLIVHNSENLAEDKLAGVEIKLAS